MCVLLNQYNLKHVNDFFMENEMYSDYLIFQLLLQFLDVYSCLIFSPLFHIILIYSCTIVLHNFQLLPGVNTG